MPETPCPPDILDDDKTAESEEERWRVATQNGSTVKNRDYSGVA